ncbi:sporulation protein YqfD [Jeotgalibacillus sp. JSM ZJ347]|uniref:sporulation protein YqfD n=1 Tax=Jeotgalibacillus sp. JSM ZJ347 TaxID=3342117 RepID=UPI0035A9772C
MIKQFLNVKVKLSGKSSSLVLNRLLLNKVSLKDIVYVDGNVTFIIRYTDLYQLRKVVRRSGCSVSISSEGKNHKVVSFIRTHVPSIAAFLLTVFIFLQAFQYIWAVEITGATPEIRDEAAEVLSNNGIKPGVRHSDLLLNQQSSAVLYKEIEQLSWSDFERKGSKLIVSLREKDFLQQSEQDKPLHLVASKTGTIHTLSVSSGTPAVKRGDVVEKGEILVSGYIGREGYEKAVRANGTVTAQTWYTVSVNMPVKSKVKKFTGQTYSKYALQFKGFQTPYTAYKKNPFEKQLKQSEMKNLSVFGFDLPVQLLEHQYKEVTEIETAFSEEQYRELLKGIARKNVLTTAEGNGQILEEKILHEDIENGKVKLTIFYEVLENIAEPKPFTEETRE